VYINNTAPHHIAERAEQATHHRLPSEPHTHASFCDTNTACRAASADVDAGLSKTRLHVDRNDGFALLPSSLRVRVGNAASRAKPFDLHPRLGKECWGLMQVLRPPFQGHSMHDLIDMQHWRRRRRNSPVSIRMQCWRAPTCCAMLRLSNDTATCLVYVLRLATLRRRLPLLVPVVTPHI
jgi:hypothetical protein